MQRFFYRAKFVTNFTRKMATLQHSMSEKYLPPVNREMKVLDRDFFHKEVDFVVAEFQEPKLIAEISKKFPKNLLRLKRISHIIKNQDGTKSLILSESIHSIEAAKQQLSPEFLQFINTNNITLKPIKYELKYDFWKPDEILNAILPNNLKEEIPSSFTVTGHIAHLNLKDEYKPYGEMIGQVIIDKNPSIRTVVDKIDQIHTVFRTFPMKVLAGDDDLIVEQKESGCVFKFDFSKVYWNSRLHTEHELLVSSFKKNELVIDVMAGVGPFSVPAGKREIFVLSNDLNPDSFLYMKENIKMNKVGTFVKPMNMDGRVLIRDCYKYVTEFYEENDGKVEIKEIKKKRKLDDGTTSSKVTTVREVPIPKFPSHFIMNLPDSALEFLNEYRGILPESAKQLEGFKLPMVHVYCFEKFDANEPEPTMEELHHRVYTKMKQIMQFDELKFDKVAFHLVRKVAPCKPMFRVSFELPAKFAFK